MKSLRWFALASLLVAAACGDNDGPPAGTDASNPGDPDAAVSPDAPPGATFTSFVIDQITNNTTATGDPIPFAQVEVLPENDNDNPNAYEALFP